MGELKMHHIGYAVSKMEKAAEGFGILGYRVGEIVHDASRNVDICFLEHPIGRERIELVAPAGPGNAVEETLRRNGPMPYHICYEVANMGETIAELLGGGWLLIPKPEKAPAIGNAPVAFLYHRAMGMIELVEIGKEEEDS